VIPLPPDDDDRAWAERLGSLPRTREPSRDLWPDVAKTAAARARAPRVRRIAWTVGSSVFAAAAAVALFVGHARRHDDTMAVRETTTASSPGAVAARPDPDGLSGLLPEEPAYLAAIAELRQTFAAREGDMDPGAAGVVRDELAALDAAIAEARAALARHPQDAELEGQLRDEYQQEIDVLSDVIDLTTRT
jgi:hypothetical protein